MVKPHLTINIHFKKMKDRMAKIDLVPGWVPVGKEMGNGEGKGSQIWWMYCVLLYENKTVILTEGEMDKEECWKG
jgi:hypothetical protein